MPVDTLFEKLRFAERRLTAAEERVVFCRAAAAKASAVLGGECVSRSREYGDLRSQICSLLQRLDDPINAEILKLRYVEHKRMTAIAKELHLSRSSIYSRHEIALSELQGILQTQFT